MFYLFVLKVFICDCYKKLFQGDDGSSLPHPLGEIFFVGGIDINSKMTGGTPEVRSDKSLTLLTFSFDIQPMHYGFCPLVKLTFKDLAKLTAFAAIFKTKSYFK